MRRKEQTAERRRRCGPSHRQQSRFAGDYLFLRRLYRRHQLVRSDDAAAAPIEITRASCVPANKIEATFKNPFANLEAAQTAPLKIEKRW